MYRSVVVPLARGCKPGSTNTPRTAALLTRRLFSRSRSSSSGGTNTGLVVTELPSANRYVLKLSWLTSFHTIRTPFTRGEGGQISTRTLGGTASSSPGADPFGWLRAINEDYVEPGDGFETHPHKDIDIVTIPLFGAVEHKDSLGNFSSIEVGDVQRMSAGRGITHSEWNASAVDMTHFLQIWVEPRLKGVTPSYEHSKIDVHTRDHCGYVCVVQPLELAMSDPDAYTAHHRQHAVSVDQNLMIYSCALAPHAHKRGDDNRGSGNETFRERRHDQPIPPYLRTHRHHSQRAQLDGCTRWSLNIQDVVADAEHRGMCVKTASIFCITGTTRVALGSELDSAPGYRHTVGSYASGDYVHFDPAGTHDLELSADDPQEVSSFLLFLQ